MTEVVRRSWSVDGGTLSTLTAGDTGPPLVLLHGIPTGAELWRAPMVPLARAGFQVLAPDLPGYGGTRLPDGGDHSLAGAARLLASALIRLGSAPAWVVGHDAGGAVGQLLAVLHPSTVSRLTLVNSIVDGAWPAPRARVASWAARAGLFRAAARSGVVPNPYMRWALRRALVDRRAVPDADFDRIVWDTKFSDPEGRRAFERSLVALSARDTAIAARGLPAVTAPCQVIWGMDDPYQRWATAGRRVVQLLPDPQVVPLERCGHFPQLECGDRLVAALLAWFDGTAGTGEP
jgi:pimeloyl-ACP methyl ester carboxylesterase